MKIPKSMKWVKLSNEEANVLDHLTRKTKQDCWFWLLENKSYPGLYVVHDLEEDDIITVYDAVHQIIEGFCDTTFELISEDEWQIFWKMADRLSQMCD